MPEPIGTTEVTDFHTDGALMSALSSLIGNQMTGLGDRSRDKFASTSIDISFTPLTQPELQALYRKSKICEKVVDLLPKSATASNWLEVTVGQGRKGVPAKALQYADDLKFRHAVQEASIQGRLDGDGFIILGIDDGRAPFEPVNENAIRQVSWAYPIDRYRLIPDANSGRPGHPEYFSYYLSSDEALPAQREQRQTTSGKVHKSRVLRFPGKKLYGDMIRQNAGYHDSVLQTFWSSFAKYLTAIEYSTRMVQDYNVFVYKLKGLANLILQGKEADILKRFRAILLSMSSLGGLAIDNENESAEFVSRNYSGLDQIIDRLKDDTGAAAGMPPSKLWGSSQKTALSNSSEGDKYEWADCCDDWRGEAIDEPATDFFKLLFLAKNGPTSGRLPDSWNLKYASALRLTLKEQAELRKTAAETDKIQVVDVKSLLPEEVRESAFGGSEYTIERTLQPELWAERQAEQEEQQSSEEADPSDTELDEEGSPLDEEGSEVAEEDGDQPTLDSLHADDSTPAKRIINWHGFKLGLQYQPFDLRHGKVLPVAYGHIQKTKGADGMACDCYVGADLESDRVFEITQLVNGQFDEHKYMLGFASQDAARDTFLKVMPAAMFGGIREIGLAELAAYRQDGGSESPNPKALPGGTNRTDGDRLDGITDEWREDAGTPCGGSWIRAGYKCTKGISSKHPSAQLNHPGHVAYQGALAAASGKHTHPAAQSNHPDHAAYKTGFAAHGGQGEIKAKSKAAKPEKESKGAEHLISKPKIDPRKISDFKDFEEGLQFRASQARDSAKSTTEQGDWILRQLAKEQGFDGVPHVVSKQELDQFVKAGEIEMARGIKGTDSKNATDISEQFRQGDYYAGLGIYGNGTYVAHGADVVSAKSYADGSEGSLQRMSLKKGAKTIDYESLIDKIDSDPQVEKSKYFSANPGAYAMLHGYDAIDIGKPSWTVVLNRTAVRVEK